MKQGRLKTFIKELQGADDKRKKVWLIGSSVVSMAIVIGLWFLYINISLPRISKPGTTEKEADGNSFFSVFSRGLSVVGKEISGSIEEAKNKIGDGVESLKREAQKTNELSIDKNAVDGSAPQQNQ